MDEGAVGLVVFSIVLVGSAILLHIIEKRFWIAVLMSSIAATIIFQVLAYIDLGYLDPFFPFAMAVNLIMGFGGAAVLGVPFLSMRGSRNHRS